MHCSVQTLQRSAIQCTAVHCITMKMYCNTMRALLITDLQCNDRKREILCPIFPRKLSPVSSVYFRLCFSLVLSTCSLSDHKFPCCCVVVCTAKQLGWGLGGLIYLHGQREEYCPTWLSDGSPSEEMFKR